MTTIAYILASSTDDQSAFLQVCDIGKADHWFIEKASCGSISVLKRPQFLEAQKFLRKGDTFVISTADILSNSPRQLLEALQLLRNKGVRPQAGFLMPAIKSFATRDLHPHE